MEHFITLLTALFFGSSGAIDALAAVFDLSDHARRQNVLAQELTQLVDDMGKLDALVGEQE